MLNRLFQMLTGRFSNEPNSNPIHSHNPTQSPRPAMSDVPVYPPVDAGIQFFSVDSILESQSEILLRLRRCAGETDEKYEKFYLVIIRNLAAYIQLLPASKSGNHTGAGGLLKLCLEMGLYSLQSAGRLTFASQAPLEIRRELEPRWRYTTFLAGLCAELYRIVSEMAVTDVNGNVWPKYMTPLTKWGDDNNIDRYYIQWYQQKNIQTMVSGRSDVALIMTAIIPDYSMQYLGDFGPEMVPELVAVASNSKHPSESKVAFVIAETRKKIFARDDATKRERYGQSVVGNHLEPYLLDAMRTLIGRQKWLVNLPKSRLWFTKDGLFFIWKNGSKEILEVLAEVGVQGVPQDSTTLAEILCDSKICERNGNELFRMMKPEDANDFYQVIKVRNPLSLFDTIDFEPAKVEFQTEIGSINSKAGLKVSQVSPDAPAIPEVVVQVPSSEKQKKVTPEVVETKAPAPIHKQTIDSNTDLFGFEAEEIEDAPQDMDDYVLAESNENNPPSTVGTANDSKSSIKEPSSTRQQKNQKNKIQSENSTVLAAEDPSEKAVIAPVLTRKPVSEYASLISDGAKKSLKPEMAEVIGKMIDDFQKGRHKNAIFLTPNGIAFDLPQLQRYGIAMDKLMSQFHTNGWLETPPENPEKKIIPVLNPEGKKVTCIVIKTKGAQFLGFIDDDS